MLGCHEFCGYYEWTFHFVRRRWGQEAVARLWAEAIGGDSQRHYAEAGRAAGLAGLYRTWVKTGEEEVCDWTFTLDETHNVLRWDMRECPSKGFLLAHGLHADEDYCDHCAGWMIPLLEDIGVEVWQHEHNHLGQCWGTMRLRDRPSDSLLAPRDIRQDARWSRGYLDRWEHNRRLPIAPTLHETHDACQLLIGWFASTDQLLVASQEPSRDQLSAPTRPMAGLLSERVYRACGDLGLAPLGVLIGHDNVDLPGLARRYVPTGTNRSPLLIHPYLPGQTALDFTAHGLPRPLPLLPLLIRTGQYAHRPGQPAPDDDSLLLALARALGKPFIRLDAAPDAA